MFDLTLVVTVESPEVGLAVAAAVLRDLRKGHGPFALDEKWPATRFRAIGNCVRCSPAQFGDVIVDAWPICEDGEWTVAITTCCPVMRNGFWQRRACDYLKTEGVQRVRIIRDFDPVQQ